MARLDKSRVYNFEERAASFDIDAGLRSYMIRVYNYMAAGLLISAVVAYVFYSMATTTDHSQAAGVLRNGVMLTALGKSIYTSWLAFVIALAPLGMLMMFYGSVGSMSTQGAQAMFWGFTALMGLSLSSIFVQYTGTSITRILLITAMTFGAFSLWGYTTKRDLTEIGSFLMMGMYGIVIASVVNLFFWSSTMQFAISAIAVVVYTGLTAYSTQQIKRMYLQLEDGGEQALGNSAVLGACVLYVEFISIFISLLQLFGEERR